MEELEKEGYTAEEIKEKMDSEYSNKDIVESVVDSGAGNEATQEIEEELIQEEKQRQDEEKERDEEVERNNTADSNKVKRKKKKDNKKLFMSFFKEVESDDLDLDFDLEYDADF